MLRAYLCVQPPKRQTPHATDEAQKERRLARLAIERVLFATETEDKQCVCHMN